MVSRAAQELRKAFQPKLTGAELARRLDVSRQAVSGWMKGEFLPTPELMGKIEDLLGIPMRSWLEEAPAEPEPEPEAGVAGG